MKILLFLKEKTCKGLPYTTENTSITLKNHQGGPQGQCEDCEKLIKRENKWIMQLGTFSGNSRLNTHDEVKSKVRGEYRIEGM